MNVIFSANSSWYIHNFCRETLELLLKKGYRVTVVAPHDDRTALLEKLGCTVLHLPINAKGINPLEEIKTLLKLYFLTFQVRPSLIFSFTIKNNLYAAIVGRLLRIPVVPTISGVGELFAKKSLLQSLLTPVLRLFMRRLPSVIFMNNRDQQVFVGMGIVNPKSVVEISSAGINLTHFDLAVLPSRDPFRFIMCGRLLRSKGIEEYVAAASAILDLGLNAEFVIVGFVDPRDPSAVSREEIDSWTQAGLIKFKGSTEDVRPEIAAAHCIVLPTYYPEGVPRSIMEAASMGRIAIASNVPGCQELIEEGKNGFFCAPRNAQSLKDAMLRVLSLDEDSLIQMGMMSRAKMEANFDVEAVADTYLAQLMRFTNTTDQ